MPQVTAQITAEELKKMLSTSVLSDELKAAYSKVLSEMNDEEKAELIRIIEEGNKAKTEYGKERVEHLARINVALKKHLQDVQHKEDKYAREQFEQFEHKEDEEELKTLEQEINQL